MLRIVNLTRRRNHADLAGFDKCALRDDDLAKAEPAHLLDT